jgi:Predicted membrane protein (DUF2142)
MMVMGIGRLVSREHNSYWPAIPAVLAFVANPECRGGDRGTILRKQCFVRRRWAPGVGTEQSKSVCVSATFACKPAQFCWRGIKLLRPRLYAFRRRLLFVWNRLQSRPAIIFILLSFAFGSAISGVVPPLRGPDEIAHFLRIYSYTRGALLAPAEVDGRKGMFIRPELYAQLTFFKDAGERFVRNREQGLRYGEIMKTYLQAGGVPDQQEQATKFMPFAGTEGYNPVAYAPYVLAAAIGDLLGLDFPKMLFFMRFVGLITFTAAIAYAIKLTPRLKWAFALIAMLPVSIYNRSVLSADGAALAYALVLTALCLSAVQQYGRLWQRSIWMTLCALSKPPQIVFVLLELMVCRMTDLRQRWGSLALVVVPSLILSPLWILAVSADIAVWRLLEAESHPREHFDPLWKLAYMWEHPLHFPLAVWTALTIWGGRLWKELIGVLGWQDILLQPSTYVALTVVLLLVSFQRLNLDGGVRARVAITTGLAVLCYVVTVYLIFFLSYTPINIDHVRGVQGRYFVIALPMATIFVASISNLDLPRGVLATTAIFGSLFSGITSFHALLGAHWLLP